MKLLKPFLAVTMFALVLALANAALADDKTKNLMERLNEPGVAVILRHALAPGTGDPSNFALRDCSTQRNLSDEGRDQSRQIGALFRDHGIADANVFSSQWCRCLETAELMGLGKAQELPIINSFFQNFSTRSQQTQELKAWLANGRPDGPVILVSHQVNMTALTDIFPSSGELLFIKSQPSGEVEVIGRLKTR